MHFPGRRMMFTNSFWTNTVWFLLLGALALIQLTCALVKSRRRKFTLAFYLSICGFYFSIEAIICCFFKSYLYDPMVFPLSEYDDRIVGNLFSQCCVASTALLIAVYGLKTYWMPILAFMYGLVEELFLRLGIYAHNWYRTWITVVGLTAVFWLVKKVYDVAYTKLSGLLRYILLFFALYTLDLPTVKWIFALNGLFLINLKLLNDGLSSYALTFTSDLLIYGICCMIIYFSKVKPRLKALLFIPLFISEYAAYRLGLFGIRDGWLLVFIPINIIGKYINICLIDWLFGHRSYFNRPPLR